MFSRVRDFIVPWITTLDTVQKLGRKLSRDRVETYISMVSVFPVFDGANFSFNKGQFAKVDKSVQNNNATGC
jgi:hypothetical protein